jgi:hypothetical protein
MCVQLLLNAGAIKDAPDSSAQTALQMSSTAEALQVLN